MFDDIVFSCCSVRSVDGVYMFDRAWAWAWAWNDSLTSFACRFPEHLWQTCGWILMSLLWNVPLHFRFSLGNSSGFLWLSYSSIVCSFSCNSLGFEHAQVGQDWHGGKSNSDRTLQLYVASFVFRRFWVGLFFDGIVLAMVFPWSGIFWEFVSRSVLASRWR